jgi:hypothetical protein
VARPTSADTAGVEVNDLNLPEALIALGNFSVRRAQRAAGLVGDVVNGRKRIGEVVVETLDGNESDLEELTLRWRLAGVRWPIVILVLLGFLGGFNAGRRSR